MTFNSILRKIWSLPRCHTSLLHLTAAVNSAFNTVYNRSLRLVSSAINSDSIILHDVFYQSSKLAYCFTGYNCVFGWKHLKLYTEQDSICASFMRDVLAYPTLNSISLRDDIYFACCVQFVYLVFVCICSLYRRCACVGVVRILYSKVYDFPHTRRHFVGQRNSSNVDADPLLAPYQQY